MPPTPSVPWRGPGPGRPALALPPGRMPLVARGRPLKRWTWAGAFSDELSLCAGRFALGPLRTAWWAVWDRAAGELAEGARRSWRGVDVSARAVVVRADGAAVDLALSGGAPVEVVSAHGPAWAWTRKAPLRVRGTVAVGSRRLSVDAPGLLDQSAGYHARTTAWRWSAGAGISEAGAPVAWNLVAGLHDGREASERTVWVDGVAHAVEPVEIGEDLTGVAGGPWRLRFAPEAVRTRREALGPLASDYVQPFGTFAGALPVAGPLRVGWGVMERHEARW